MLRKYFRYMTHELDVFALLRYHPSSYQPAPQRGSLDGEALAESYMTRSMNRYQNFSHEFSQRSNRFVFADLNCWVQQLSATHICCVVRCQAVTVEGRWWQSRSDYRCFSDEMTWIVLCSTSINQTWMNPKEWSAFRKIVLLDFKIGIGHDGIFIPNQDTATA